MNYNRININYNKKLVCDITIFKAYIKKLENIYPNQVTFNISDKSSYDLYFNDKLIYSLDDSFDEKILIDEDVLKKSMKYIENSIDLGNSRDLPRIDDIGIVDY